MTMDREDYAHAGTLIHGTHRAVDLIPAFLGKLRELDPERAAAFEREWPLLLSELENAGDGNMPDDETEAVVELTDALSELAPEGWYFGAIEGDGSDFGFWRNEEADDAPAELTPYGDHGPSERPDPSHARDGALAWRFITESDPERPGKWRPTGFLIVYPTHLLYVGLDGIALRDSLLHSFDSAEPLLATPANMRKLAAEGTRVFSYSPTTNERFSASAGDYFQLSDDAPLRDSEGEPMILARERIEIVPYTKLETANDSRRD